MGSSGLLWNYIFIHFHSAQFFCSKKGIPWSNSNQYHILNLPPFFCQGSKGTFHLAPVMALAWPFLDFCWAEGHSGTCATFQWGRFHKNHYYIEKYFENLHIRFFFKQQRVRVEIVVTSHTLFLIGNTGWVIRNTLNLWCSSYNLSFFFVVVMKNYNT